MILVDIATGGMATDGAIPDDRALQSLRHGSPALPPHVGGLPPEQCSVLAALRDGARIWRQWPERERGVPVPCCCARNDGGLELRAALEGRRLNAHGSADGSYVCITARAENPRGSKL